MNLERFLRRKFQRGADPKGRGHSVEGARCDSRMCRFDSSEPLRDLLPAYGAEGRRTILGLGCICCVEDSSGRWAACGLLLDYREAAPHEVSA